MRVALRSPRIADQRFFSAVQFIQMAAQGHAEAGNFATTAAAQCAALRQDFAEDPAVWQLSSMVENIMLNRECARYFLSRAIRLGLDADDTRGGLNDLLSDDPVWPDAEAYLEAASSIEDLIVRYRAEARSRFDAGDLATADLCCQRVSALGKPLFSEFKPIRTLLADARGHRDAGTLRQWHEGAIEKTRLYWSTFDADTIDDQLPQYAAAPDRAQFAEIVSGLLDDDAKPDAVVLEVGCFVGFNLNAARERLSDAMKTNTLFVGVEPNAAVVAKARSLFPGIEFMVGDHQSLIAGRTRVPKIIDVCTISRVLMLLMPEDVGRLLRFLAPRTRTLVVCDDILNLEGETTVVRSPPDLYLVHNFGSMFKEAGFGLEKVILADVPDRECTGFLVARGQA